MNDPRIRRRLLWLAILGGVLLLSLLFISLFAPSDAGSESPVLRPAAGSSFDNDATSQPATSPGQGFSLGGGQALSLVWRLGLVAVIICVSIAGLRWWGKRTAGPRSSTGFLRVVDTLAIGNGRMIHLVAVGDRVIAIGATTQQLTLLNELSEEEGRRVLNSLQSQADQPFAGFATELFQSMRRSTRFHAAVPDAVAGDDAR